MLPIVSKLKSIKIKHKNRGRFSETENRPLFLCLCSDFYLGINTFSIIFLMRQFVFLIFRKICFKMKKNTSLKFIENNLFLSKEIIIGEYGE